jgi:hypothetical protein
MSDSPGQILCTIANDPRLIVAGAAAISSHAARRAGLSREAQDEIAEAAIEVCCKAFPPKGAPEKAAPSLRFDISDLPDRIEVTLEPAEAKTHPASSPVKTSLERTLSEQIRWDAAEGYFHMTILRLCGTQSYTPAPGDSSAHR